MSIYFLPGATLIIYICYFFKFSPQVCDWEAIVISGEGNNGLLKSSSDHLVADLGSEHEWQMQSNMKIP